MLTDKEKEKLGKCLLENINIEDIIEYFGSNEILSKMNYLDIADFCDYDILSMISDEDLADAIFYPDMLLERIDCKTIADFLREKHFNVIASQQPLLKKIQEVCREIKPKGYIGQEEAKKILCDYIDTWMINAF